MLKEFISTHLHYPEVAKRNGIRRTVVTRFIVEPGEAKQKMWTGSVPFACAVCIAMNRQVSIFL